MSAAKSATVIAIAAPPGGGKTTLANLISARLHGAPLLHFDDYETFTKRSASEIEAWLARGAPLAELTAPGFGEELARLRTDGSQFVVVDAPIGRAHPTTAGLIDFLIFIDTPLDLALARLLRAHAKRALSASDPTAVRNCLVWLESYLQNYVRFIRRSYAAQRQAVLPDADLVLDGVLEPQELAERAIGAIAERAR